MTKKNKVSNLVTINTGHVGDRTLREMDQALRVDLVRGDPLKTQILFTRRHLANLKQSTNVGYITYSRPGTLFALARDLFAAGMSLILHGDGDADVKHAVAVTMKNQVSEIVLTCKEYLGACK